MIQQKGREGKACCEGDARVSRALWPVNARRAVATHRIVQRRRQLILTLKSQWWMWLLVGAGITAAVAAHLWLLFLLALAFLSTMLLLLLMRATRASHSSDTKALVGARHLLQEWKGFPGKLREAPVPGPLVRVLETVDLSQTDGERPDIYWSSTSKSNVRSAQNQTDGERPDTYWSSPRMTPTSSMTPTRSPHMTPTRPPLTPARGVTTSRLTPSPLPMGRGGLYQARWGGSLRHRVVRCGYPDPSPKETSDFYDR